jgi:hypothetical protein
VTIFRNTHPAGRSNGPTNHLVARVPRSKCSPPSYQDSIARRNVDFETLPGDNATVSRRMYLTDPQELDDLKEEFVLDETGTAMSTV